MSFGTECAMAKGLLIRVTITAGLVAVATYIWCDLAAAQGSPSEAKNASRSDIVCIGGCVGKAPEPLYRSTTPQQQSPRQAPADPPYYEVRRGIWCSENDGCAAIGTLPLTHWQRQRTPR